MYLTTIISAVYLYMTNLVLTNHSANKCMIPEAVYSG